MKVSRHFFFNLIVALLALAVVAGSASAQSIYGSIRGLVTDPSSAIVANAKVIGVVDGESRGPKLRVFKKKRRKGFRKTRGHRSTMTRVRITDIQA